jgi:hypothetical protein
VPLRVWNVSRRSLSKVMRKENEADLRNPKVKSRLTRVGGLVYECWCGSVRVSLWSQADLSSSEVVPCYAENVTSKLHETKPLTYAVRSCNFRAVVVSLSNSLIFYDLSHNCWLILLCRGTTFLKPDLYLLAVSPDAWT